MLHKHQSMLGLCSSRLFFSFIFLLSTSGIAYSEIGGLWKMGGQNIDNSRHQKTETKIGPDNVADLDYRWVLTTGGDVSATPAVDGKYVYVPDFAGNLFKVNRDTGDVVWQKQISDYTGVPGNFSRTTPAIHGNLLVFGDQAGRFFGPGANVMAVDKNTGDLVWVTQVDSHPSAIVTQSATIHGSSVYVGVSSYEELHAAVIPGYQCCSFSCWKTYTRRNLKVYHRSR